MNKIIRGKIEEKIKEISEKWGRSNIYYVGGYVRDELSVDYLEPMIDTTKDIDLVIDKENGSAEFIEFLKENYPQDCIDFVEYPRYGTAKFTLMLKKRKLPIECVSPRVEKYDDGPRKPSSVSYSSIKEDALRRDFCCNALYKNTITGEILDPTGRGIEDIKNKILRTPLDPEETFKDDPLRMLRAIRFAAKLNFTIEEKTFNAIKPIPEYYKLSMERVNSEFSQILLKSTNIVKHIWMLHDTGLLGYIIPELEEAWGFDQNSKYHSMNLTDHTLAVLSNIKRCHENFCVNTEHELELLLAGLLHDISKYKTYKIEDSGFFSYHNHEEYSADMARNILSRLRYSNDTIEYVCALIRCHMKLKPLYDDVTGEYTGSKKSTQKLIKSLPAALRNDQFGINCLLHLIDADNKSHAPQWNMPGQAASFWKKYVTYVWDEKPNYLVNGADIMKRFNLGPGKHIGYIKDIIGDYAVDHPDYGKDKLLDLFDEEYGDKHVYIFRRFGTVYSSVSDPSQEPGGIYDMTLFNSMEVEDGEKYFREEDIEVIEKRAVECLDLYTRTIIHIKSREILKEAWKKLSELQSLPGFEKAVVSIDNSNDVNARVEWKDYKTDFIM